MRQLSLTSRRVAAAAVSLVVASGAAACAGPQDSDAMGGAAGNGKPQKGGTLTVLNSEAQTDFDPEQWAWSMLLPWITLGLFESAKYARLTRSSTLETLAEDHIRTFRAYGVAERAVVGRHALRGAVPPVISLSALDLGTMMGGAVLTESLFGIPGLGKTLIDGVRVIDLPVVVGVVLVIGAAVVLANVVADLLYAVADRRVVLA